MRTATIHFDPKENLKYACQRVTPYDQYILHLIKIENIKKLVHIELLQGKLRVNRNDQLQFVVNSVFAKALEHVSSIVDKYVSIL